MSKSKSNIYTMKMSGYGGEIVLGPVSNAIYDYFKINDINLNEFSNNENDTQIHDPAFQPFEPGYWWDCNGIAYEFGIEMSDTNLIEIFDQEENLVWSSKLDAALLEEFGCEVNTKQDVYVTDQAPGSVVFYGQQVERGTFFHNTLETQSEFDPTLLTFHCVDIEGWSLCTSVSYNEQIFHSSDDPDIIDETNYFVFVKILEDGDTESYTGPEEFDSYIEDDIIYGIEA